MLGCQQEVMALCAEMGIVPNTFSSYAPGLYSWSLIKATLEYNGICVDDGSGMPLIKVPGALVLKPSAGIYHKGLWDWDYSSHYPRVMCELNISPETVTGTFIQGIISFSPIGQLLARKELFETLASDLKSTDTYVESLQASWYWFSENIGELYVTESSHCDLLRRLESSLTGRDLLDCQQHVK